MDSMQKLQRMIVAAGMALACALPLGSAQAGGVAPGFHARMLLKYGSGWRLYEAGCLTWNYQQHAWFTRCGLPQNAAFYAPPAVVVAKD